MPAILRIKKGVIIDSTIIGLFDNIMRNVGRNAINGKKKGGIKLHCAIEDVVNVPRIYYISEGTAHDQQGFKYLKLEEGNVYIMDRGYCNYERFDEMSRAGVYFVSRLKKNAKYKSIKDIPNNSDNGIINDEIIEVKLKDNREIKLRRVVFWDDKEKRLFEFITNLMEIEVDYIPKLYKYRWQIEICFRQLKQNFQMKYFLGDNENAIRIQIWCTLIVNLLLMVIYNKVREKRKIAFSNVVSFVRLNIHSYVDLIKFLEKPEKEIEEISGVFREDAVQLQIIF